MDLEHRFIEDDEDNPETTALLAAGTQSRMRRRPAQRESVVGSLQSGNARPIVCGAQRPRRPGIAMGPPYVPQPLPLPLPLPQPSSSSSPSTSSSESTGCGARVHAAAHPARAGGRWVAQSQTDDLNASVVIPLPSVYFSDEDRRVLELGRTTACGCGSEGVGCAICGNPLGALFTPCRTHTSRSSGSLRRQQHYVFLPSAVSPPILDVLAEANRTTPPVEVAASDATPRPWTTALPIRQQTVASPDPNPNPATAPTPTQNSGSQSPGPPSLVDNPEPGPFSEFLSDGPDPDPPLDDMAVTWGTWPPSLSPSPAETTPMDLDEQDPESPTTQAQAPAQGPGRRARFEDMDDMHFGTPPSPSDTRLPRIDGPPSLSSNSNSDSDSDTPPVPFVPPNPNPSDNDSDNATDNTLRAFLSAGLGWTREDFSAAFAFGGPSGAESVSVSVLPQEQPPTSAVRDERVAETDPQTETETEMEMRGTGEDGQEEEGEGEGEWTVMLPTAVSTSTSTSPGPAPGHDQDDEELITEALVEADVQDLLREAAAGETSTSTSNVPSGDAAMDIDIDGGPAAVSAPAPAPSSTPTPVVERAVEAAPAAPDVRSPPPPPTAQEEEVTWREEPLVAPTRRRYAIPEAPYSSEELVRQMARADRADPTEMAPWHRPPASSLAATWERAIGEDVFAPAWPPELTAATTPTATTTTTTTPRPSRRRLRTEQQQQQTPQERMNMLRAEVDAQVAAQMRETARLRELVASVRANGVNSPRPSPGPGPGTSRWFSVGVGGGGGGGGGDLPPLPASATSRAGLVMRRRAAASAANVNANAEGSNNPNPNPNRIPRVMHTTTFDARSIFGFDPAADRDRDRDRDTLPPLVPREGANVPTRAFPSLTQQEQWLSSVSGPPLRPSRRASVPDIRPSAGPPAAQTPTQRWFRSRLTADSDGSNSNSNSGAAEAGAIVTGPGGNVNVNGWITQRRSEHLPPALSRRRDDPPPPALTLTTTTTTTPPTALPLLDTESPQLLALRARLEARQRLRSEMRRVEEMQLQTLERVERDRQRQLDARMLGFTQATRRGSAGGGSGGGSGRGTNADEGGGGGPGWPGYMRIVFER
ncbi:hypothetical protein C8F01DRAFT_216115 [Mycena amicta]|nr:hypothetical protein C8F01DRAFT_216115 [Mycena amicta]